MTNVKRTAAAVLLTFVANRSVFAKLFYRRIKRKRNFTDTF